MASKYRSLSDYLSVQTLSIDVQLNDYLRCLYPVKGREIEATILFADISGFSKTTKDATPRETLAYINKFFRKVYEGGLKGSSGIVDKYIGDEIMVIFSKEFGSDDPIREAIQMAHRFCQLDIFSFEPHIGIAHGSVIVGYVGTPDRYDVSVFGSPVTIAARCTAHRIAGEHSATVTLPEVSWDPSYLQEFNEQEPIWTELPPEQHGLKNCGTVELRTIVKEKITSFVFDVNPDDSLGDSRSTLDLIREQFRKNGG